MEVMIVKNSTIAKILLGTFVLPSFMAVATPICAVPGGDDTMAEQTTQSAPAPGSAVDQADSKDGNLLLKTMNETEKEQIRSYLENHISEDGVLDLSQIPTSEMPKFKYEMFNLLERRNSPVRNVRLSYKHLYDMIVKEAIGGYERSLAEYKRTAADQMKFVCVKDEYDTAYYWKRTSGWFVDILEYIKLRNITLSFDYIMPFAPDPYDTSGNSVLNIMDIYSWIIRKHKLENTNSLLVYTTPTFTANDWIKNTSGLRQTAVYLHNHNLHRGEALKCIFENNNPMYAEFTRKSPLENVLIFSKSSSVNQDAQILEDFFGKEFNYNGEILINNQLNPTNIGFATSVLPKNTDRAETRLEPVYLHNVFLYAQNHDIFYNTPLQRNFSSVSKKTELALQQLRTMNIEQFISLNPNNLELVSGLQTIVVTSYILCSESISRKDVLEKLPSNLRALNEIKKRKGQQDEKIRILMDIRHDNTFVHGYNISNIFTLMELFEIFSEEFITVQFDSLVIDLKPKRIDQVSCEFYRMAVAQNLPLKHLSFTGYRDDPYITDAESFCRRIASTLGGPNEIKKILKSHFTKVEFCGPHNVVPEVARRLLGPNVSYLYNNVGYLPHPFDRPKIMTTPSDN